MLIKSCKVFNILENWRLLWTKNYLAWLACYAIALYDLWMLLSFLNGLLRSDYLGMYWMNPHQIFNMWVGMINLPSFLQSVEGRCYGNQFLTAIREDRRTHIHSMRWHSTTDGRIATWMRALTPPTSVEILVNFGPVTAACAFAGGLHAGLCHTFLHDIES